MKYLQKSVKEQTSNGVAGKFGILLYLALSSDWDLYFFSV